MINNPIGKQAIKKTVVQIAYEVFGKGVDCEFVGFFAFESKRSIGLPQFQQNR